MITHATLAAPTVAVRNMTRSTELHWLPVRQRLKFKTAVLVFKCLHGLAPAYLADYCQPTTVTAGRTRLRSAHTRQLAVPRTNTSYGDRSFAVSGSSMWNSLPAAVRSSDCAVTTFRTQLKTLLFVWLSDYVVTVELLPDSALVALRRFCAIQMAVIIIIIINSQRSESSSDSECTAQWQQKSSTPCNAAVFGWNETWSLL